MLALAPYGFLSEDQILSALRRPGASSADEEVPAIERAVNRALSEMETYTGRRLACRTYRDAVAITGCTLTANSTAVTGSGFTAGAKAGDAVLGSHLQPGTTVASVTSNTALVLSVPAAAASSGGGDTLTFGSERLQIDGSANERHEIWIPETPVQEVYSAAWLDQNGGETGFTITGARLEKSIGRYILPNDWVPPDAQAILIACRAGYVQPTATERGNPSEWTALAGIQIRLAQVFFDDERRNPGRALSRQLVSVGSTIPGFLLPDDIKQSLAPFRVRG